MHQDSSHRPAIWAFGAGSLLAIILGAAVMAQAAGADIFIAVAAVADYRPLTTAEHKLKKTSDTLTVALTPNPDILAEVAAREDAPFCVGFAAESRDLALRARIVGDGAQDAHVVVRLVDKILQQQARFSLQQLAGVALLIRDAYGAKCTELPGGVVLLS